MTVIIIITMIYTSALYKSFFKYLFVFYFICYNIIVQKTETGLIYGTSMVIGNRGTRIVITVARSRMET